MTYIHSAVVFALDDFKKLILFNQKYFSEAKVSLF